MPTPTGCLPSSELKQATHAQMALVTSRFLSSNFYFPSSGKWTPRTTKQLNVGSTFMLRTSNAKPKTLILSSSTGYGSKGKGISVATTDTSQTRSIEIFDAYEDEYGGVIIDPRCLPDSGNAFVAMLQSSLSYWKLKGKKGIWLKILKEQADLVPIALKEGFCYHHAEPDYLVLTYWIPDTPCLLPYTATHQVGVGAFVINDKKEVLVVKEKNSPLICSGIWKMPTGLINKSEEIYSGAIREVKEETGIDTTFLEVVAFRHAHHVLFEKSDLFFVCMLNPLSYDITIDEFEIQAAKWMPLSDFIDQPFHREDRMLRNLTDTCIARYENRYRGFTANPMMSKFDDRLSYLYCGDLKGLITHQGQLPNK
ncbi:nudix hydrolase 8-like [Iris pallida]|uniref:Nudix hydrolase 8-like n=1 Tax=Iris pallida TaxID=29817 RepID=A0AAX6ELM9_IRIPA|nr:nudix hydrolase 8-like [Iris pallida]